MTITDTYKRIPLSQVVVDRTARQRREIKTDNLLESIRANGVLNPIILTAELRLVAGERRLACARELGHVDIPARFIGELDPLEAQIIELDENLRRSELPWRDQVAAVARLHALQLERSPTWTQTQTAQLIGTSIGNVSQHLRVARDLDSPKIAGAAGMSAAYNILSRVDDRAIGDAMADIADAGAAVFAGPVGGPARATDARPTTQGAIHALPTPPAESILNLDFIPWIESYNGPRFNLLHCDFPYGINVFAGKLSGRDKWTHYNDDPDVYWQLIGALCKHLDRVMAPSAHMMFWMSMDHYTKTLETFRQLAPSLQFSNFPLVWVKSDNVGILPDPKRGPRRIYETCLIASREDRLITRAVSNAYSCPTDKAHHPSTKPEPMLREFMRMYVDDNTRLLDPTCGSGSSLRAAESLGAKFVLGLERDPEHFRNAQSALRQFRTLRKATSK